MGQKKLFGMLVFVVMSVFMLTAPVWAVNPVLVKDVENPAQSPFWGYALDTIPEHFVNVQLSIGTIPVGKRLVIEHVAVDCATDADDNIPQVRITVYKKTTSGWSAYGVPLLVQKQGNTYDGKASWAASQAVRLYSDGVGAPSSVDIRHSKVSSPNATCYAVVSGYTVDTP